MLVLARKPGERIFLQDLNNPGDEIEVCVVRIGPNTVRIGIEAPAHWKILRQEHVKVAFDTPEGSPA